MKYHVSVGRLAQCICAGCEDTRLGPTGFAGVYESWCVEALDVVVWRVYGSHDDVFRRWYVMAGDCCKAWKGVPTQVEDAIACERSREGLRQTTASRRRRRG
jgi:hypothetical protein